MANVRPTLTGLTTPAPFIEGGAAVRIAPSATVNDDGNLKNGRLVVSGLTAGDRVTIRDVGGELSLFVSGSELRLRYDANGYNYVVLGTISGGAGVPLAIQFSNDVSNLTATQVLQNLQFSNGDEAPIAQRVLSLDITDSLGQSIAIATQGSFVAAAPGANPFAGIDVGTYAAPTAVDVDGNYAPDLVVGSGSNGVLSQVINNRNGTFTLSANDFAGGLVNSAFQTLATADLNGDDRIDVVSIGVTGGYRSWTTRDYPGFDSTAFTTFPAPTAEPMRRPRSLISTATSGSTWSSAMRTAGSIGTKN